MKRREFMAAVAGAAAWPVAAHAQSSAIPVVGFIGAGNPADYGRPLAALLEGLGESGYIDGKNIRIEYRWANNQYGRLSEMAAELVRKQVAIIAAPTTPSVRAAKAATATIPIVFTTIADPVQIGFVDSLSRPGGNATGVTMLSVEVGPKLLELLHGVLPSVTTVGLLVNPINPNVQTQLRTLQAAALKLGLQVHVLNASSEADFDGVFAKLQEMRLGGLMINQDPLFTGRVQQLAALTVRHRIPAIFQLQQFATSGGLMSYGASLSAAWRQAGVYIGRILKGEKPSDLPIVQASKFDFVINLKTAKTMGLTIPDGLVNAADEVIE